METPEAQRQMANWHEELVTKGACILKNFIRPESLSVLVNEATRLFPLRHRHTLMGNAYLTEVDESLPADDPRRMTDFTTQSAIAYDEIPLNAGVRLIYEWPLMDEFVRRIVGCREVHHYECPMGGINVAVMEEGDYLRWHFDQAEFVVSIHLQDPEVGGVYEFVRNLRSPQEPNYNGVREILQGGRKGVEILGTQPGALILFQGVNTIHRVTKIHGKIPRLVVLYGYADRPGVNSTDFLKMMRYGRTLPLVPPATFS